MAKPWPIIVLVAGCAAAPPPQPIARARVAASPSPSPSPFAITESSLGAITGKTRGTLEGLRAVLPGFEVTPVYDGGLEYHVSQNGEHLYYVIPADDGTVFNVHVVSGKLGTTLHPWRAGEPFKGAALLTMCECWGDQPVCFRHGEHVAVAFKRSCEGLQGGDPHAHAVLDGVTVQRMIWSPTPFGGNPIKDDGIAGGSDDPPPPPEEDN